MRFLAALAGAIAVYAVVMAVARRHEPPPARRTRVRRRPTLATQLAQAGVGVSPARFRGIVAVAVIVAFVVVWRVTGTVSLAVPAALMVGLAPRGLLRRRHRAVLAERTGAWPEAARDVLAQLSVGATLPQALAALAVSGPTPLRSAFARFDVNATLYGPVTALEYTRAELADPVADRVIEVFIAAHEHGSEVVIELLRSLVDNVTRDVQLRSAIRAGQAEVRAEAVLCAVLPFAVLGYLCMTTRSFRDFYATTAGWLVIAVAAGMSAVGWKAIGRIARVPAERRVLTGEGSRP